MKNLEKNIRELQEQNKLVVLRSCGGSEQQKLLAELTQGYTTVDLSLPNLRLQAEQNPQMFVEGLRLPVYLADVQYTPSLLPVLLASSLSLSKVLVSCTQSYYVQAEVAQVNGGGSAAFIELPLSMEKAAREPFIPQEDYLRALSCAKERRNVVEAILGKQDNYAAWVRRVLQRDIMERTTVSDEVKFYRFLCAVAAMAGCVVNYTILANNVGITAPTAKQWLQFLAGTGLVYLLRPVERIAGKRLVKAPKVYFRKTGAAAHLLQLHDSAALLQSVYFKNLLENYTVNMLREGFLRWGIMPDLRFYRDSNNKEITLLLTWQKQLYPMYITLDRVSGRKLAKNAEFMRPYAEGEGLALQPSCVFTLGGSCTPVDAELWQVGIELL